MRLEIELLKMIRDGKLNPRSLLKEQRLVIIDILRYEGMKRHEISELLKISIRTVDHYYHTLNMRAAVLVKHITIESYAGQLMQTARQLKQSAIRNGDHALAWKIESELCDKLQSLGFIHRAPQKIEMEVKENAGDDPEQKRLLEQYERAIYGTQPRLN